MKWFLFFSGALAGCTTILTAAPVDGEFSRWLAGQELIQTELRRHITSDRESGESFRIRRAQSMQDDLDYMLRRIEEEKKALAAQPDFAQLPVIELAPGKTPSSTTAAVADAIVEATRRGGAILHFPAGEYRFQSQTVNGLLSHILLAGKKHIMLRGEEGTRFIFTDPTANGILIVGSENIRLENIELDYQPRPYAFGRITCVGPDSFDVKFSPAGESPELPFFGECDYKGLIFFFSADNLPGMLRPRRSHTAHYLAPAGRASKLANGEFRFAAGEAEKHYRSGDQIVYMARQWSRHAVFLQDAPRCRLKNLYVRSSPAMSFLSDHSPMTFITGCRVEPAEESFHSTNADTFYIRDSNLGGLVADNSSSFAADDFLNVHDISTVPERIENGRLILRKTARLRNDLRPGCRVGLIFASRGETAVGTELHLREIVENDAELSLAFEEPLPENLVTRAGRDPERHRRFDLLTLLENQAHGLVFVNNRCFCGSSRVLIGGRNIYFGNNTIIDRSNGALFVLSVEGSAWAQWLMEGHLSRNIILENNHVDTISKKVFRIDANLSDSFHAFAPARNSTEFVALRNNLIEISEPGPEPDRAIISANNADDLELSGNVIRSRVPTGPAIEKVNCGTVTEYGNIIDLAP